MKINNLNVKRCIFGLLIIMILTALFVPVNSFCKANVSSAFSYVADFAGKAANEGTTELIGGVNMLGENENVGLYLNPRAATVTEKQTCTYNAESDYLDINGNELYLKAGSPVTDDTTIGFRMNMGDCTSSSSKYATLSVKQGVIKDLDGDGIAERFDVKDGTSARQELMRCYFEENKIRIYSYVDGKGSNKELHISNKSWFDVKIEIDYASDDSEILYTFKTYINNKLCGEIEIPKTITTSGDVGVSCSSGNEKTFKKGSADIAGPYQINLTALKDTLIKGAYIHSGVGRTINAMVSVDEKTDVFDKVIVEESFGDKTLESNIELMNFNKATSLVTSGHMTLSYAGDGNGTANNMSALPYIRIFDNDSGEKYSFSGRFKFDDFRVERNIFQLISVQDGMEISHTPLLRTKVSDVIKSSSFLLTYRDNTTGNNVVKEAAVSYKIWYNVQISLDLTAEYPSYHVNITDENNNVILDEYVQSDKTAKIGKDGVHINLDIDSSLEHINSISGTTTMYIDDIHFSRLKNIGALAVDDIKVFCNNDVGMISSSDGNIKVDALVTNYSLDEKTGIVFVGAYSAGDELILSSCESFTVNAAFDPYISGSLPTAEAVFVSIKNDSTISYVKVFVLDNINNLKPHTKIYEFKK